MFKKISILLLTLFMVVPAMAQPEESCECMYAPKAGQWQIDLVLGQGQFFNDMGGYFYLLPDSQGAPMGIIGNESDYISGDLTTAVFNIGSLNLNSLTNIVGLQARYFVSNRFDINLMGAYNVNLQPYKNFIEGERFGLTAGTDPVSDPSYNDVYVMVGDILAQKAVLGNVTNSLMGQIGSNYYFNVKNPRINPYLGVYAEGKWARIRAFYPYTGETVPVEPDGSNDIKYDDISIYRADGRAGQLIGIGGGLTAGVSYSLAPGLVLSFEVKPVAYQFALMHLQVDSQEPYRIDNHNISAFKYPQLKLGIRF